MLAHILCVGLLLWVVVDRLFRRRAERELERAKGCHPVAKWYPHIDVFGGLDLTVQIWREFRRGELSEGMRRRHDLYGSTFMARGPGSRCIYTVDHQNIRAVTTTNFEHWGKSAWVEEAAKHVGNGVLLNEGEAWKKSRNLLRPIFARTAADTPTLLEPHLQRLVGTMRAKRGEAFDFQKLAGVFVLDVTTEFLFGQPTNCLAGGVDAEDALDFLSLVKKFESPSAMFMAVGMLAWLQLLPNYQSLIQCVNGMKSFFRRKLDSIIASGKTPQPPPLPESRVASPNVFRMMKAQGIPEEQIQGELQNIFFASYDTTTALLSNLIELLARNTQVQQRLRREITECLEGRPAKSQDLLRMEYLQCVISEALRLYSPVTSHSRQANQDTTLPRGGGADGSHPILVPAGTTVVWSTYALNRNPEVYGPDWAEFRPERWWKDRRLSGGSGSGGVPLFMPFGSGPRTCMGQQLVQAEVGLVLVRLLQAFSELRCEDTRPFREANAVSFYNCNGTLVSARS